VHWFTQCVILTTLCYRQARESTVGRCIILTILHAEKLDLTNMQNEQGQYDGTFAYARDKRRQVAMAERFAELWGQQGTLCAVQCWHRHHLA
jgi:hypothetical protein